MTVKTRLERLEKVHQAATGFAVVVVGRGEAPDQAIGRAGIAPDFKGTLVVVNRGAAL